MTKVRLFQDRILTDAERLALAMGAATYRWGDAKKAPVGPLTLLNPRRFGDGAKDLWTTLNTVQKTLSVAVNATTRAAELTGPGCQRAGPLKASMKISSSTRPSWQMAETLRTHGIYLTATPPGSATRVRRFLRARCETSAAGTRKGWTASESTGPTRTLLTRHSLYQSVLNRNGNDLRTAVRI
jgi:hypothetical protein